jgi:2-phosphoglycerate kinase
LEELLEKVGWRVLLIGGNSGVGKTFIARELVRPLGIPFIMADDIRIALQQATTAVHNPNLHVFLGYEAAQWQQPETILRDWITVANEMIKPLKAIMTHHIFVEEAGRLIIEGDSILPALVRQQTFKDASGFDETMIKEKIQALFVIEDNEEKILSNLRQRDRGISAVNEPQQAAFARASALYGRWLAKEARDNQIPVLAAEPRENIIERVLKIIT